MPSSALFHPFQPRMSSICARLYLGLALKRISSIDLYAHIYIHIHTYIHIYTYVRRLHTQVRTYTHTHTHTHREREREREYMSVLLKNNTGNSNPFLIMSSSSSRRVAPSLPHSLERTPRIRWPTPWHVVEGVYAASEHKLFLLGLGYVRLAVFENRGENHVALHHRVHHQRDRY